MQKNKKLKARVDTAIGDARRTNKEVADFKKEMSNTFVLGGAFLFTFALLWDVIADLTNQHFNPGISTHQKILFIVGVIIFVKGIRLK